VRELNWARRGEREREREREHDGVCRGSISCNSVS
jgi:hypothetical protein